MKLVIFRAFFSSFFRSPDPKSEKNSHKSCKSTNKKKSGLRAFPGKKCHCGVEGNFKLNSLGWWFKVVFVLW